MARNVRTYDHFCVLARALEVVGDRWTLLVVRDLLTGAKRFTGLMERLGGITPKTLTQRLRELEDAGLVRADREPGRREVRYQLTPAGQELAPAIADLAWWGWRHAWRLPAAGEPVHAEHVLLAVSLVLDHDVGDRRPARWHLTFTDDGDYTVECDGERWTVTSRAPTDPTDPVDVSVTGTMAGFFDLARDPTPAGAERAHVEVTGRPAAVRRFQKLLHRFHELATTPATPTT